METKSEYGLSGGWSGRGSLQSLVKELERQKNSRIDFVADTRSLKLDATGPGQILLVPASSIAREWLPGDGVPVKVQALEQMGQKSTPGVPVKFIKEMAQVRPGRLADLMNGLHEDEPSRRLVRMLDGQVRAFLSDRYRVLDNFDIAFAAMDAVRKSKGEIIEASLSDTHMRIKFTSREIWDVINVTRQGNSRSWYSGGLGSQAHLSRVAAKTGGDLPGGPGTVHPLVTITNSETGHGGYNVRIGLLQAICFNLATVENVVSRVHLGDRLEVGIFSEETVAQDSKAIFMKARDAVKAAFQPDSFRRMVDLARAAQEREVKAPQSAVANIAKANHLSDEAKESILSYFVKDYDMTNFGLAQAIARFAQDEADGDKASAIEDVAGAVMASATAY